MAAHAAAPAVQKDPLLRRHISNPDVLTLVAPPERVDVRFFGFFVIIFSPAYVKKLIDIWETNIRLLQLSQSESRVKIRVSAANKEAADKQQQAVQKAPGALLHRFATEL